MTCSYCEQTREDHEFKDAKGRRRKRCADCRQQNAKMSPSERARIQREKAVERTRRWIANNLERAREHRRSSARRDRQQNPDKLRARYLRWRDENPDKARSAYTRWAKTHPVAAKMRDFRRRSRMRDAGRISEKAWSRLQETTACTYCETPFSGAKGQRYRTVDHVHPLSRGGNNADDNLVACCALCNSRKNKRTIVEWAETGRAPEKVTRLIRATSEHEPLLGEKTSSWAWTPVSPVDRDCASAGSPADLGT